MNDQEKLNYYDLWKHFSDDAEKVKDKLWTVSIWLFTLLASVLGFAIKLIDEGDLIFRHKPLVITACLAGLLLSLYAWWMITSYGKHVRTAWNRTNYLRDKINGLNEAWFQGYTEEIREEKIKKSEEGTDSIPSFAVNIRYLVLLFFLGYILVLFWCLAR